MYIANFVVFLFVLDFFILSVKDKLNMNIDFYHNIIIFLSSAPLCLYH